MSLPTLPPYSRLKSVSYAGRLIYTWEQTLDEVHLYIPIPPNLPSKALDISFTPTHLRVGVRGNHPYLDEALGGVVVPSESLWVVEDGELHVQLHKGEVGSVWVEGTVGPHEGGRLVGGEVERERGELLKERFQREMGGGGFDFSQAQVSGNVPDVAQFMGGIDRRALG